MASEQDCGCAPGELSWNITGDLNRVRGSRLHGALAREFDAWAEAGRGAEMEAGHGPTALQALARFPFREMQCFVDVGCGNGYAVRHAAAHLAPDGRAIGIDLANGMLRVARAATDGTANATYLRAVFQALPFADSSVDGVFSHEAIYYAPDVAVALADLRRVLRPGGRLVVALDFFAENEYSLAWPQVCGIPMTLDSEKGWRERFQAAGFIDVESARLMDPSAPIGPLPTAATPEEARRHALKRRWVEQEGTLMVTGRAPGAGAT